MNKMIYASALAGMIWSTAASASNELILLSDANALNLLSLSVNGNENRLQIVQEHPGAGAANSITAVIEGDLNGGPLGSRFAGPAMRSGLQPGTLSQAGFGNSMNINVNGSSNLFAFAQTGSGNHLSATITGYGNQAAVVQAGFNNHAAFSQNGVGNIINISQTSW